MPDPLLTWVPAVRIVARADAIDALVVASAGTTAIRLAADELLVADLRQDPTWSPDVSAIRAAVDDPHAIVELDGGWQVYRRDHPSAHDFLTSAAPWFGDAEREVGSIAQGMAAGVPIKVVVEAEATLIVMAHAVGRDFAERVTAGWSS